MIYKVIYRKDRATRTPIKPGDEQMCYGRINNSCSTSGTRRVTVSRPRSIL